MFQIVITFKSMSMMNTKLGFHHVSIYRLGVGTAFPFGFVGKRHIKQCKLFATEEYGPMHSKLRRYVRVYKQWCAYL